MNDRSGKLKPEEILLLSLCRLEFDDTQKAGVTEDVRQVTDWKNFTRLANEHGIIALIYFNIGKCGLSGNVPAESLAILENGYRQSLVRNTWLTERWKEVNTILCNAGLKHILLKGLALEHTIYGSRGLRQMNDNDILLKSTEAMKAWNILQQNGFRTEPLKSPLFRKIMFELGHHLPALYKNGYAVEIHNSLPGISAADDKEMYDPFADPAEILIGDAKACILPEDIHRSFLIDHMKRHARSGDCQLRLYLDIILLDKNCEVIFPPEFISDPKQGKMRQYRIEAYRSAVKNIPARHRLRFIAGDIFPSMAWMKKRYKCSGFKLLLRYPKRAGKLLWLI
jgi:hypothetical protein